MNACATNLGQLLKLAETYITDGNLAVIHIKQAPLWLSNGQCILTPSNTSRHLRKKQEVLWLAHTNDLKMFLVYSLYPNTKQETLPTCGASSLSDVNPKPQERVPRQRKRYDAVIMVGSATLPLRAEHSRKCF
ncbi:hypothetical protein NDU88_005857 [Pleurodeles waltl]|uniref:Uncharacterized protein n=1 Tax=Pleurodeles waltl TaxID=8319 RepID=A0AAV7L3V0_PLEWA|nr:hypothetical protein NDU88_005857 [Pleurodeles waltl]